MTDIKAKRSAARGRKRKGGARTPSGRLSRSKVDQQENVDPILTRMRMFGLTEEDARDQKAATFIGRLQLTGAVTEAQYNAAQDYLRVYEAFQRAVKSPDALRTSGGGGDQSESEDYAEWCEKARERFKNVELAIRAEQMVHANRSSNLFAGLDYIVRRDEMHWHLVGDARLALNALAHHFAKPKTRTKTRVDIAAEPAYQNT